MSNSSLKRRIALSLDNFEKGTIDLRALKDSIESNGAALERMPHDLIREIQDIYHEVQLQIYAHEEDCETKPAMVSRKIKDWLKKVPE